MPAADLPENMDQLIQVKAESGQLFFNVPKLHWHESEDNIASLGATNHCPAVEWLRVSSKPAALSKDAIVAEQKRILGLKKYFRRCTHCEEIHSVDYFNTEKGHCDACAEQIDGICF